ncbi:MAG: DUF6134 family protein [Bacteroidota bacterium]
MKALLWVLSLLVGPFVYAQRGVHEELPSIGKEAGEAYHIIFKNNKVGSYEVKRYQQGDSTVYRSSSISKVRFIGTVSVKYELKAIFKGDRMVKSVVKSYRNGKLNSETLTELEGAYYTIVKDGKKSSLHEAIKNSVVQLYFGPPNQTEKVFSEQEGAFRSVKPIDRSTFQVGKTNPSIFRYSGGILERVDVSFTLAKYSIIK